MRRLLRANGTAKDITEPRPIAELRTLISADTIDSVQLRHMGNPLHLMLVDDRGHEKGLPVNEEATRLYLANCYPGTTHQIRGDVVIVPDEDFA